MPTFQVDLKDGRTVEFEADRAPTEDEFNQAIAQQAQQPEQPKTSALGAAGRSAATGILPSAAAGAGFVAGAELGAPLAPATFGIAPLVTGAIGAGVAGYAASRAQQAGIHAVAPQFEQLQQADVEQHPVASAAGRIASMAPSFAIAPGQAVKGLAAIPAIMRGKGTELGVKAAKATAAQVGVQAGLTTAQTAIQEHKLPTAGELAEASVAALIYGQPRIKALLPRSVAAAAQATGAKPNAVQVRSTETLPVGQTPGSSAEVGSGVSESKEPAQAQAAKAPPVAQPEALRMTMQQYGDLVKGERPTAAATMLDNGEVLTGAIHPQIVIPEGRTVLEEGFSTNKRKFVSRAEAAMLTGGDYWESVLDGMQSGAAETVLEPPEHPRPMQWEKFYRDQIAPKEPVPTPTPPVAPAERDDIARQNNLDMVPGWSGDARGEKRLLVKSPAPNEIWYNGGSGQFNPNRPFFLTRDRSGAEWYAANREEGGNVSEWSVNVVNPARYRQLMEVVKEVGASKEDIKKHSDYDGSNDLDYVYVPKVREALIKRGFDSVLKSDVLENGEVDALVPLSGHVIERVSPKSVQPPVAPPVAQPQELRLTADDQAHLDAERGSVDVPVEVTTENQASRLEKVAYRASAALEKAEKQGVTGPVLEKLRAEVVRTEKEAADAEEPFGYGNVSSINREKGTIEIYPEQFSAMLNQMEREGASPEKKRLAVRSLLAEERNHLATSDADAEAYAGSLSAPEMALERKLYTGKFGGVEGISPRDIGYEAIRRRMQRLARMDSTEVARAAGLERWSLKSLETLNDVVRKVRETLGTKASKEGLAILDKVQGNLDAAKAAVGGQPASFRKVSDEDYLTTKLVKSLGERFPNVDWGRLRELGQTEDLREAGYINPDGSLLDLSGQKEGGSPRQRSYDHREAGGTRGMFEAMSAGFVRMHFQPSGHISIDVAKKPTKAQMDTIAEAVIRARGNASLDLWDGIGKYDEARQYQNDPARKWSNTYEATDPQNVADDIQAFYEGRTPGMGERRLPASLRRKTKDEGQAGFYLPGSEAMSAPERVVGKLPPKKPEQEAALFPEAKGQGALTQPPTESATAAHPEFAGKPVTATELESDAARHLSETARPSFDTFASDARTKYGSNLQPGQLRELWQNQVWKRLQSASGSELGKLRDQLGLGKIVGTHEVADVLEQNKGFGLESEGNRTAKALDEDARTRAVAQQRYRANVEARIGEKLIGEADTGRKAWKRKEVTPDEVATWRESSEGAFRPISQQDVASPESLGRILTEGAATERSTVQRKARGGEKVEVRQKAPPESVTKRLTALVNKVTGKVELVSTYRGGRTGAMLVDPVKLGSVRPNVPLASILSRYRPIYSVLLDEPVQNFHQSFDSLSDFEQRFGQEAKAKVEEASRTAEPPAAATEAQPEPSGSLTAGKALQDPEAEGVLNQIVSETGDFKSPDDVFLAIDGLANDVKRQPSAKLNWPAINGFSKIYNAIREKWPLLDHDQAMAQMAEELYDRHQKAASFDEFITGATEAYQPEGRKAVPGFEGRPVEAAPRAGEAGTELTMPIERRPPTDVRPENVPPGSIPEKRPAPSVPEGGITPAQSKAPASLRRLEQAKDKTLAEAERLAVGIRSMINRKDVSDALPKNLDAAENIANNVAREREAGVRLQAGSTKPGGGNKEVLRAANPVRDSGAVVGRFKMSDITPAAQAKFKLLYRDYIAKHPAANPFTVRIEALKQATSTLINEGDLRADRLTYSFNDAAKAELPGLMNQVDTAAAKARADLKGAGWFDKNILKKKLRFLQGLREELLYADRNWADPQLRDTAIQAQKGFDELYQRAVDTGSGVSYNIDHSPGRYEGEFVGNGKLLFPGLNVLGGRWKSPKTFDNIYEAVNAGPYMSITRDIASMVGHSARQVERSIARREYIEGIKNIPDPESGLPIAAEPVKDAQGNPKPPSVDYEIVFPFGGQKGIAIHRGWVNTVKALTGNSVIQEFPPARIALELAQRLKHTLLVGDFFHLGRLSYYGASIMGRKAGFKGGLAALDFRERDLPQAVRQGVISKEAADWVTERIPVRQGASTFMRSRREIAKDIQGQGLNVGQIQDALYKDLTGTVPIVGPYNKWLFDSYTRGLMMESAVKEFERLNKSNPNIDSKLLMRDIARDTNRFFGSIGRQGWFKSRTWQDLSRLAFLAPQWVEGLIMKEAGFAKRLVSSPLHLAGLPSGRRGLPPLGTLGKGIGYGLLTMMAMTQALNLITRRKPTWQNEEEGHKMDAWIPGGEHGFFLSPLSVFNELSHDLVRYFETKPKAWDAVSQIGQNKLSPFGRLALVLATSKSPTGEYQTTTAGLLGKAAEQVAPAPISFSKAAREVGHAVAPGLVAPNQPGAFQRQAMQWAGLKAEPVSSASQRVSVMAKRFMDENGLGKTGMQFEPTDQPSYMKLRSALRVGDNAGALQSMKEIGKTPAEIGKAMKNWSRRPWTVSRKSDNAFFSELTDAEMNVVSQARLERQQLLERFYDLLSQAQ